MSSSQSPLLLNDTEKGLSLSISLELGPAGVGLSKWRSCPRTL